MNKLSQVAAMVKRAGAAGSPDTILAHITPREAAQLKAQGGSGRIDPRTGLPHFDDGGDGGDSSGSGESYSSSGYGPTQQGGSFAGFGGAPSYTGFGSGYTPATTDPTYNANGYYSAAGGYAGGEEDDANPTRYYASRRTIGGEIANNFGLDPEGFAAGIGNVGVRVLGSINPFMSIAGKAAQATVGAQSDPHLADSEGNGGSLNALGRFVADGSTKLASALSNAKVFRADQSATKESDAQDDQGEPGNRLASNSVASAYSDLLRRRRQQA